MFQIAILAQTLAWPAEIIAMIDPPAVPLPGTLGTSANRIAGQFRTAANILAGIMFFGSLVMIAYKALTQQPLTEGLKPVWKIIVVIFLISNGPTFINGLGIF